MNSLLCLRVMKVCDLDAVMQIENLAYEYPWSYVNFDDCLRSQYWCRVAVLNERIVGYGVLLVAAGEAQILNVTVAPDYQSKGIGGELVKAMIKAAERLGADTLFLEVRPSNHAALTLYQRCRFVEIGIRPGYYPAFAGREDALLMAREILRN